MITLDDVHAVMSSLAHAGHGFTDEYYALARIRHGLTSAYLRVRPTQQEMWEAITAAEALLVKAHA